MVQEPILPKLPPLVTMAVAGIIIISLSFSGCSILNRKIGLKNDNVIEEMTEKFIEHQTGIDIDLTPEDAEN